MLLSEVDDHRVLIDGITSAAAVDLSGYTESILDESPARVSAQVRVAAPAVVATYGEAAAVAGATFYEMHRPEPGFTAPMVGASIGDRLVRSLGWALAPLFDPARYQPGDVVTRLSGVVQQYVAGADRATIEQAARSDSMSTGVDRYARPGACAFCALMTAQGVTGGGHWHDDCKCVSVPTWEGSPGPDSAVMDRYSEAAGGARETLLERRRSHPDYGSMSNRRFLRRHPQYAVNNKNILQLMREQYGFTH